LAVTFLIADDGGDGGGDEKGDGEQGDEHGRPPSYRRGSIPHGMVQCSRSFAYSQYRSVWRPRKLLPGRPSSGPTRTWRPSPPAACGPPPSPPSPAPSA